MRGEAEAEDAKRQGLTMKAFLALLALSFLTLLPAQELYEPTPIYQSGDVNLDGVICMNDSIGIIMHLWVDGRELPCSGLTSDVDRNGSVGVEDVIGGLRHVFYGDYIPDCPISCPQYVSDPSGDESTATEYYTE